MKIAVDTNVLVRIITQDDPIRVKKAYALIEHYGSREIFVCHGVLLETYFVLRKKYQLSKEEILEDFEELLKIPQFCFEYEPPVRLAISKAAKGYSFNDALIGEIGASRNLKTHTFDTELKDNKNFEFIH
jgi:predicted nucleic-acid-binding protein